MKGSLIIVSFFIIGTPAEYIISSHTISPTVNSATMPFAA